MELNLIIEDEGTRDPDQQIVHKLTRCESLGFKTVALAVVVDLKISTDIPRAPDLTLLAAACKLNLYSRLTVKVSENIQLYKLRKSKEFAKYDLLALEPQNAKILQYISTGSTELDILTFNLAERIDYSLFKVAYKVLEERGVCTEINYGPAQLGSSLRRNIICNAQNLTEKSTKNLILSNGVMDLFRVRGPKDAACIGLLFLLSTSRCHEAVFRNGLKAIHSSKARKNPTNSAIELVKSVSTTSKSS